MLPHAAYTYTETFTGIWQLNISIHDSNVFQLIHFPISMQMWVAVLGTTGILSFTAISLSITPAIQSAYLSIQRWNGAELNIARIALLPLSESTATPHVWSPIQLYFFYQCRTARRKKKRKLARWALRNIWSYWWMVRWPNRSTH